MHWLSTRTLCVNEGILYVKVEEKNRFDDFKHDVDYFRFKSYNS